MHARLVAAINASVSEIWSPWYGFPGFLSSSMRRLLRVLFAVGARLTDGSLAGGTRCRTSHAVSSRGPKSFRDPDGGWREGRVALDGRDARGCSRSRAGRRGLALGNGLILYDTSPTRLPPRQTP
jgi:hypothetical protein